MIQPTRLVGVDASGYSKLSRIYSWFDTPREFYAVLFSRKGICIFAAEGQRGYAK